MQKVKKNMRKINFQKAVAQKFKEYDQNLEALTNITVFEAFEKLSKQESHDNQDPPKDSEGKKIKKQRKDVGQSYPRSSGQKKSPMVHAKDETPAIQPLDQEDENVQNHLNLEWFPKKSGPANAKRRTTWFDLPLKLDIVQNENHIL
ncbi:hypothetical protein Tco_0922556 [Tanacetum coccineum]|uniref:Uncharacterized protein n=1 Tax=Tanacetum coccineum TaxID=301880 RepID=A0ABQ5D004_9ASTR